LLLLLFLLLLLLLLLLLFLLLQSFHPAAAVSLCSALLACAYNTRHESTYTNRTNMTQPLVLVYV
jgi:4-hydroxybenzoate polyprenyltransferase